jgi:hypothetical protein
LCSVLISAYSIIWDDGNCESHANLRSGLEIPWGVAGARIDTSRCREVSF